MPLFCDLHIHSYHSRATSRQMNVRSLSKYAKLKGLDVLGTGDFTHPVWMKELKQDLTKEGDVYSHDGVFFIPSSEVSLIYSEGGSVRKIHLLVLAKDLEIAEQINEQLLKYGRLDYDGRPIFGKLPCPDFVDLVMSVDKSCVVIPAHIWTPWFSLFGANSGFDSIKECFKDQVKNIKALETGLSSDPAMNWRLSQLDDFSLVSFSDSHSPWPFRLGRECCVLDTKPTYKAITDALMTKKNFLYTIEVDPSYGKYHLDGHRNCDVVMEPKKSEERNNICPVCHRPLTIGVLHRVEELADREEGFRPKDAVDFKSVLPLAEVISVVIGGQPFSKKVVSVQDKLIKAFGNELSVLLDVPMKDLVKETDPKVADAIIKVRDGKALIQPGYDGVYGQLILGQKSLLHRYPREKSNSRYEYKKQKSLAEYM